ncbi:MAG: response regulator [Bacteroidetes bacterium]|nr:response regulator [Bacteroidota bacterium]MCH8523503.1 response regulator [Balneolales bacterium]
MRVLLVDTCPNIADQVRVSVRAIADLRVDHVIDYKSALDRLQTHTYATIICDFTINDYSAADLLNFVTTNYPDIPFILLANQLDEQIGVEFMELGASDYIHKESIGKLPYVLKRTLLESNHLLLNRKIGLGMHDLMSPITAIKGYLDLMKTQFGDQHSSRVLNDYSQKIRSGVQDISTILDHMRNAQNGMREEEDELCLDVDLNWVAREVCDIMQGAAQSRYHILIYKPFEYPVYVSVDIPHLKRILYNFISNAIRYTPERGEIVVEVGIVDDQAYMAVTDTGIGIPQEKHEQIFRMNAKLQKFDLYNKKSTGLGLYVNASLARQLGGKIEVESEPGEGSTFRLKLPIQSSIQQTG